MRSELPNGWAECLAGDIATIVGGGTPDAQDPENFSTTKGIPWLTPADLSDYKDIYISRGQRFLTRKGYDTSSAHLVRKGAVLFSSRAPIGYVAVAANEICTNQGFKTFVCHDDICPEYIYFYLKYAKPLAEELASGTTFAEISGKNTAKIPVRVAPLAEQRRIVATLETLSGKVGSCQEDLAKIPILLKRCRQSILAAACSGRLTADWRDEATEETRAVAEPANVRAAVPVEEIVDTPDGWRWLPLHALCDPARAICYGVIKLGEQDSAGVPCLRTSDVKALRIDTADVKRISREISNDYRRTLLRGGEVLVNVRGTLGGVAVVPPELREWNISREVALVPLDRVSPKFIAFWIASLACQNWLTGVAKGVAYTGINIEDLRLLPVAVPSPAEQDEIVRRVEALFALVDKIEARLTKVQAQVDKLAPSLLARAFRGELVPTEDELARREKRDYESASALLERIHSEHERAARQDKNLAEPRRRLQRAGRSDGPGSVSGHKHSSARDRGTP